MRVSGMALMSLGFAVIGAWVVITALKWPLMSGIFVVIVGTSVCFMGMFDFCVRLFGDQSPKASFKFPEDVDRALALRRVLSGFLFIIGFFLLIVFLGFPIAVPLFVFLYLKLQGEKWRISLGLSAAAWLCFYGLFIYLLKISFLEGWVQRWLRTLGTG